jgi:RHS repeat-associated protein
MGYTVVQTNGVILYRSVLRDPYRRQLVTTITNWVNGTPVTPLSYTFDEINRVASRNNDSFVYNSRSEVISADVQSTASRYAYDGIGNNLWTSVNFTTNTYTANALNQYETINATPLAYDSDGNLLTNGVWSYTWDGENRLKAVYSNSVFVVSNAYDHAHRRVLKVTPTSTCTYLYDGWNLVQETVQTLQSTVTNRFVWGRDLSGSLQGAGGIGGLLAVQMSGSWYFPLFDHNGNATYYVSEQGSIAAQYTYDAFGRTLTATGPLADAFRHRFSTKYFDAETGMYYYGMRFYMPSHGRWLNRDPIEEFGGLNLYATAGNQLLTRFDY